MKTFNIKLLSTTFLTLFLLTGCMPDSLTKFKKDPPKKPNTDGVPVAPPIGDNGQAIDTSVFTDPTTFKFKLSTSEATFTTKSFEVGQKVRLEPVFDGSIQAETIREKILIKCEVITSAPLPPGLTLNSQKCFLNGTFFERFSDTTPGNIGKPVAYTIRMYYISNKNTQKTLDTTIYMGVYDKLESLSYTQNDRLSLKINVNASGNINSITPNVVDSDPYTRTGLLSSPEGIMGVIKYVDKDTSRIGIAKVIPIEVEDITALSYFDNSKTPPTEQYPSLTTARFITNNVDTAGTNDAIGKVVKLYRPSSTSTRGIVYVEIISKDIFFQDGQYIDDTNSFAGNATRITVKNSVTGTIGVNDQYILDKSATGFVVDNDYQFFVDAFSVATLHRTFEPNVLIENGFRIKPLDHFALSQYNNVTFSVSPSLPEGLSLNTTTGEITGAFSSTLDGSNFTLTARNDINSVSTSVGLSAIYAPKDLSYTDRQLISIKSFAKFIEGEMLYQPITPPMETNLKARILRKIGVDKLSIENSNGQFKAGAILDSGNAFYSEKSSIPTTAVTPTASTSAATPIIANYNIALTLSSAADFNIEGYVSNAAGALGRIVAKEGNIIFVQYLTPSSPAIAIPFVENQNVRNAEIYASGTTNTTITQIDATNLKITLGNPTVGAPSFKKGYDINTTAGLAAYIYDIDNTVPATPTLWISDITKKPNSVPYFDRGQAVFDDEIDTGNTKEITAVSTNNSIIIENGTSVEIQANLLRGNSTVFSVTPALPLGLTLNSRTGVISGKPTTRTPLKEYLISAVNLIGKSEYVFELEVRDYFRVADNSGAASFILHKNGTHQQNRRCGINATDIIEADGPRDIRCYMEAEEQDLHYVKMKLASSAGAGVCEFISVTPFSFWKFPPRQTNPATIKSVLAGVAKAGDPGIPADATTIYPTAVSCEGNYSGILVPGTVLPNCDEGSFQVDTYTGTDRSDPPNGNSSDPTDEVVKTSAIINCNGRAYACLDGPVRDILDETAVLQGNVGMTYPTSSGLAISHTYSAPADKGYVTNLRAANSVNRNKCSDSRADATAWASMLKTGDPLKNPLAKASPYYTYNCLDSAKDIKARIRILVRDWDRTFKINFDIDNLIPYEVLSAGPPETRKFYMDAGTVTDDFGERYNNYEDWDDSYLASYCSDGVSTTKAACIAATETWYSSSPTCSDPQYKDKYNCEINGETWDLDTGARYGACGIEEVNVNNLFKFPGSEI